MYNVLFTSCSPFSNVATSSKTHTMSNFTLTSTAWNFISFGKHFQYFYNNVFTIEFPISHLETIPFGNQVGHLANNSFLWVKIVSNSSLREPSLSVHSCQEETALDSKRVSLVFLENKVVSRTVKPFKQGQQNFNIHADITINIF